MSEDVPEYIPGKVGNSVAMKDLPDREPNIPARYQPQNPMELLAMAVSKDVDIEKMQALMAMEKDYRGEKAKSAYSAAIAKFAGMKAPIVKNTKGKGPGGSSFQYAEYFQIVDTITPWLKKCDMSFDHQKDAPVIENNRIVMQMVYCQIRHKEGHVERFPFPAIVDYRLDGKLSPVQLLQMAVTYAKRQSLCDGLGLSTEDDSALDADAQGNYAPKEPQSKQAASPSSGAGLCSQGMIKLMRDAGAKKNLIEFDVCALSIPDKSISGYDQVPFSRSSDVLEFIKAQG